MTSSSEPMPDQGRQLFPVEAGTVPPREDRRSELEALSQDVLLHVAQRLGPYIDRIDVEVPVQTIPVRGLLETFAGRATPAEVRAAIMDMIQQGWITGNPDSELISTHETVGLRVRGLMAAREVEQDCGRSVGIVTLRMRHPNKHSLFAARFDTGNPDLDRVLNRSGLTLAAFYVVGVLRPSKAKPLMLAECKPLFARLAITGIGTVAGRGARIEASDESIAAAMNDIRTVVGLVWTRGEEDSRRVGWYLQSSFPDVRIVRARGGQYSSWQWVQYLLGEVLHNRPCVDAKGKRVEGSGPPDQKPPAIVASG